MHCLVRAQERLSMGATVDTNESGQGPADVHGDPSISGIAFGTGEKRISLAPGVKGHLGKGPNMAPSAVSLLINISGMIDG